MQRVEPVHGPAGPQARVQSRADDSDTGSLLANRFQLLRTLGEGGYGSVYEAFDLTWSTHVALKTLHRMDPDALLRFKDEFRSLQDLEHPHLVHLNELMCSEGLWFFTMELVEGTDFFDWVRPVVDQLGGFKLRRLDERRLRRGLVQLVDALAVVHASGRVHCDIKPTNIRVDPTGRLVLLDFGLVTSVLTDHVPSSDEDTLGTPSYMAPEQCRGDALTAATDWYGVGVLLYEALTGRLPFEGDSSTVFVEKQHVTPIHAQELAPSAPDDLCDVCMQLLRVKPAERPSGGTLLGMLLADNDALSREASARHSLPFCAEATTFIGRGKELTELGYHLNATRSGRAAFVYVAGESGVGKTSLARAFAERVARTDGALVLRGRCYERETVPYKAFDGIIDDLARYLGTLDARECRALLPVDAKLLSQIFPVLSRVKALDSLPSSRPPRDPKVLRTHTFAVLREILTRLAEARPVLLLIDDLQWTDLDSLSIMEELLHGASAPPCMVLAMGRPTSQLSSEVRQGLVPILEAPSAGQLDLAGLSLQEAELLVRGLAKQTHDSGVFRRIASEAKGHPLFVAELVRHVEAGHVLDTSWQVDDAVRDRVSRLEPDARRLLATLAIAGAPTAHVVLAQALELNATQLGRRLAQLRAAHLVRSEDRSHAECYHDRVRRAVLNALPLDVQRECHRGLARALSVVGGAEPEQVAFAWRSAGDAHRAARYCADAAAASYRALAFNRATRLYDEALSQPEAFDPAEIIELRVAQAQSLSCAGFAARAADMYLEASLAQGCAPDEARALRRKATQLMLRSGRIAEGLELADRVLAEVGMSRPTTPTGAVLRLVWERTRLAAKLRGYEHDPSVSVTPKAGDDDALELLWGVAPSLAFVDLIGGSALQSMYARLALSSGDVQHVVRSLAMEALLSSTMEAHPQPKVTAILQQVRLAADSTNEPYHRALAWLSHGYVHWSNFRLKEAVPALVQAERILREACVDVAWELTNTRAGLLNALWNNGQLWRHDELATEWARDARERGDRNAETQLALVGLAYQTGLRRDDPEGSDQLLQASLEGWPGAFQVPHWSQYIARQLVALYRGDGGAHALLRATWPKVARSQLLKVPYFALLTHSDAAWACLDECVRSNASRRLELLNEVRHHTRGVIKTRWPFAQFLSDQITAQVQVVMGNMDEAVPIILRAEAGMRAHDSIYQYPTAYLSGQLLGGDAGRALATRALDWATREGISNPVQWFSMFCPVLRMLP